MRRSRRLRERARALPVTMKIDGSGRVRRPGPRRLRESQACLRRPGIVPLQHRLGRRIGLLQFDAPVFQLLERDRHVGDRAAHECARPDHAEVAVEIFHLRLPRHRRRAAKAVEHVQSPFRAAPALCGRIRREAEHNGSACGVKPFHCASRPAFHAAPDSPHRSPRSASDRPPPRPEPVEIRPRKASSSRAIIYRPGRQWSVPGDRRAA